MEKKFRIEFKELVSKNDIVDFKFNHHFKNRVMKEVLKNIKEIEDSIKKEIPIDMIETDLKKSWDILGEIIGETYSEELIDQIFSRFCLGK